MYKTVKCLVLLLALPLTLIFAESLIEKCPGKEVFSIRQEAAETEISIIFYYVSWCNESRGARKIYEEVAQHYSPTVCFAMADCWHLACNCSKTHPNGVGTPNKWPTMMIKYGRRISLQYNGEWTFGALNRFLNKLLMPVERLESEAKLRQLAAGSDAICLGLFMNANSPSYAKFISAAVKWLETDPEGGFRFAVAFGAAAFAAIGEKNVQLPVILLVSANGLDMYNISASKWNSNNIVLWLQSELKRSIMHLNSYSSPTKLANHVVEGPVVALFAKQDFYSLMKPIIDYKMPFVHSEHKICKLLRQDDKSFQQHSDYILYLQRIAKEQNNGQSTICHTNQEINTWNLAHYYSMNAYLDNTLCKSMHSCTFQLEDLNSADKLLDIYRRYKCLQPSHIQHEPNIKIAIAKYLRGTTDEQWRQSLSRFNRSMSLVILDNDKYHDFLDARGIINLDTNPATTFIVDPKTEGIFVMQEGFTYSTFVSFVQNYYNHNIASMHRRSSVYHPPTSELNSLYLHDLNRQIFLNVIQQENATTVVLIHSPECVGFSALMSHTLMQVTGLLDTDNIKILRIDSQSNELPFEYVMPTTPTLIVFPRGRAMESRVFPSHLKIDVRNVLGFILAQMDPVDQVKTILGVCRRYRFQPQRLHKCLQFAKTLATQHIGHHLKMWQIFTNERLFVLERLKQFKDISLDIKKCFLF